MKKIIFATFAASVVAVYLMVKRSKKNNPPQACRLAKRIGNEEKHLITVFSTAKKHGMQSIGSVSQK